MASIGEVLQKEQSKSRVGKVFSLASMLPRASMNEINNKKVAKKSEDGENIQSLNLI